MWQEQYEALSNYEKGEFRRLGNYLLSHSYIVREGYDITKKIVLTNEDYRMVSRLFSVMSEYFEVIGWKMVKDDTYGVIAIYSLYDNNRLRIDRFTTLFLYTLRLIYEEEREKVNNHNNVRTDTQTIIEKMMSFGLIPSGRTTIRERIDAQRALAHYNIIQKIETTWRNEGNTLIIHPSILFIIPNDGINRMIEELKDMKDYEEKDMEEGEDEEQ